MQTNPDISLSLESLIEKYQVTSLRSFLYYLTHIWRDLSHHSLITKVKGISRVTFSKYYDLPGIISGRLFAVFDKSNQGSLSPREFIDGMLILFSESMKILTMFIFNFYDFNNDGCISREDVHIVLSYVPLSTNFEQKVNNENTIFKILNSTFGSNETLTLSQFQKITETSESEVFAYLILFLLRHKPFSKETLTLFENKAIAKNIKASIHISKNNLSTSNSSINFHHQSLGSTTIRYSSLAFFPPAFYCDMDIESLTLKNKMSLCCNGDKINKENEKNNNNTINPNNNYYNNKLEHRSISTFGLRKLNIEEQNLSDELSIKIISEKKPEAEDDNDNDNENYNDNADYENECQDQNQDGLRYPKRNHEGYLHKLTTTNRLIKRMWYKLIGKDMFYYKRQQDSLFRGMHNLSGAYIKENEPFIIEEIKVYSFSIIYSKISRTYYALNQDEYNEWIDELKAITNSKKLEDEYEINEMIYEGIFSQVYMGKQKKTDKRVAIKLLDKKTMNSKDLELVKTEIDIMKISQHPNIIKLYDVYENEETIFIVTEYCSGGDLFSYVKKNGLPPEKRVADIVHKISLAVYFIHSFGIVHRDIKLNNILLSDDTDQADVKLLDFGLSTIIGPGEKCSDSYGTLNYAAPEILNNIPYDQKADLWSIGVISFLLLTSKFPFGKEKVGDELIKAIIKEDIHYSKADWNKISPEGKSFVKQLLQKDPKKRMSIKDILLHGWIQKYYSRSTIKRKTNAPSCSVFKFYTTIEEKDIEEEKPQSK